jgi:hypothetical protein
MSFIPTARAPWPSSRTTSAPPADPPASGQPSRGNARADAMNSAPPRRPTGHGRKPGSASMSFTGAAAASSPAGWAVVTGASSGLGREFALALGERGYPVLAVARRGERLSALADDVEGRGGRLDPLVADLSTPAGIDALLARAAERQVELLVNNAGVATYGPFASAPADGQRGLVRLNVETIVCADPRAPATDARPGSGWRHQCRLSDGVPAHAVLRRLCGEHGVRAQLLGGTRRGTAPHGRDRHCGRARLRQHRVHRGGR